MSATYHVPTRPYTPIDALNRRAAAVGSPGYAQATAYADYNGHAVQVHWNDFRGYYIAEYFWAGRVVLARGDFATCLRAALDEYRRGALGCSVTVTLRDGDDVAGDLCLAEPLLVQGSQPNVLPWWTWRHADAAHSVRDYANPGMLRIIFDWPLMQTAADHWAYVLALETKYGRAYD